MNRDNLISKRKHDKIKLDLHNHPHRSYSRVKCDECADGRYYYHTPISLDSIPPQYPVKCDKCGHTTTIY